MKIWIWFFPFYASLAHAIPEMVRYGYTNCTACHVAPSGGGVLTPYGRGLSAEAMSTWGDEKEAQLFHGALGEDALKEWLHLGGDYRGLQSHYENDLVKRGKWIPMQASLEAAIQIENWIFDLAFGKFDSNQKWSAVGTKYYVLNQITEEISIRAGRFTPQFGLNIPDHISPTRGSLGLGQNAERNSFELQYADVNYNGVITYSEAPLNHVNTKEKAVSFKAEVVLSETLKPGVSYWFGENEIQKRQLAGAHAILGFSKELFLLTELDWQEVRTKSNSSIDHSAFTYQKLGYEFYKGVVGLLLADAQLSKLEDPSSQILHYGLGVQFFPRPHFEIQGAWLRERAPKITSREGDYAYLLLHYYL